MCKVKVVDSIMGSGKTTKSIEDIIVESNSTKFMYITPLISEIERIKIKTKGIVNFKTPDNKNEKGTKLFSIRKLLANNDNVVATHALFSQLDLMDTPLLKNYTLVLDEVMNVIDTVFIKPSDVQMLISDEKMLITQENRVVWLDKNYDGKFDYFKKMVENTEVIYVDNLFFVWQFPKEILLSFKKVKVLTYMFESSIMKHYFDLNGIEYEVEITDDKKQKEEISKLIKVYFGERNTNSDKIKKLSKRWFQNASSETISSVKSDLSYFFKYVTQTKSEENGWTTFQFQKNNLKGKGYTKGFIPCNEKGTNIHSHKKAMAYILDLHPTPHYYHFFAQENIELNGDGWALSMMIQWIWRGCIRNGEEMHVYIPSFRMRRLFLEWLYNGDTNKIN